MAARLGPTATGRRLLAMASLLPSLLVSPPLYEPQTQFAIQTKEKLKQKNLLTRAGTSDKVSSVQTGKGFSADVLRFFRCTGAGGIQHADRQVPKIWFGSDSYCGG